MRWEHTEHRKITWSDLWRAEPSRIKFLIRSVYDVLPSPSNLHLWNLSDTPACQLCKGVGTLEHILSSCPSALGDGRYRWRHDQVLRVVADVVSEAIKKSKNLKPPQQQIHFIKAGEKSKLQKKSPGGLLATARDWILQVDLERRLKFPQNIYATSLRPDIVLSSESTKQVVLLELTVPWEDRLEEAHERKRAKYQELVAECKNNGWKTRNEPIEVGCRGFVGGSLLRAWRMLGIRGKCSKQALKSVEERTEKASRWLWIRRGDPWC